MIVWVWLTKMITVSAFFYNLLFSIFVLLFSLSPSKKELQGRRGLQTVEAAFFMS